MSKNLNEFINDIACPLKSTERYTSLSEERRKMASDKAYSTEKYNGTDVKVSPMSYYNPLDALNHAIKDFETQASQTINAIKTKRLNYGQSLITKKDIKDVATHYNEGKRIISVPGGLFKFIRHRYVREFCGYVCLFEIDESTFSSGKTKRKSFTLDSVAVCFYLKNSDGIGKETILKNKIMRFRRKAGRSGDLKK